MELRSAHLSTKFVSIELDKYYYQPRIIYSAMKGVNKVMFWFSGFRFAALCRPDLAELHS